MQTAGNNRTLQPILDTDQVQPLSPEDTRDYLRRTEERLRDERRKMLRLLYGPDRSARKAHVTVTLPRCLQFITLDQHHLELDQVDLYQSNQSDEDHLNLTRAMQTCLLILSVTILGGK